MHVVGVVVQVLIGDPAFISIPQTNIPSGYSRQAFIQRRHLFEHIRDVINNLLHLVIVKHGVISLVVCICTRLQ